MKRNDLRCGLDGFASIGTLRFVLQPPARTITPIIVRAFSLRLLQRSQKQKTTSRAIGDRSSVTSLIVNRSKPAGSPRLSITASRVSDSNSWRRNDKRRLSPLFSQTNRFAPKIGPGESFRLQVVGIEPNLARSRVAGQELFTNDIDQSALSVIRTRPAW